MANYTGQAATFQKAGIAFGFSTLSAKTKDLRENMRKIIAAGLSEDAMLAALTTTPAQILGMSDRMGSIDNGKMANLVISDKPYFNEKSKVRYVFVEGVLHAMEIKESKKSNGAAKAGGSWSYTTQTPQGVGTGKLVIKNEKGNYSGTITSNFAPGKENELTNVLLEGNELTVAYVFEINGERLNVSMNVTIDEDSFEGSVTADNHGTFPVKATRDPKE